MKKSLKFKHSGLSNTEIIIYGILGIFLLYLFFPSIFGNPLSSVKRSGERSFDDSYSVDNCFFPTGGIPRPREYASHEDWNCETDRYKLNNPVLFPIIHWNAIDNHLMGYMDRTGKVIIEPQYSFADDFYEGLARVYVGGERYCGYNYKNDMYDNSALGGGKYGYIDTKGIFVIKPQFYYAGRFNEGLAAAKITRKDLLLRKDVQLDKAKIILAGLISDKKN